MALNSCVLVKTAPEIFTKSDAVQRRFLSVLMRNIRVSLKANNIKVFKSVRFRGRLVFEISDSRKALKVFSTVFGLHEFSPCSQFKAMDLESVSARVLEEAKLSLRKGDSFCVRCHRSGSQSFSSKDVEIVAGKKILDSIPGLKVDLSKPKKTIFVELQQETCFVFSNPVPGLGGLPVGSQGTVGLLLDSKKGLLETGFLLLKRGCRLVGVGSEKSQVAMLKKLEKFNSFEPIPLISEAELVQSVNVLALASPQIAISGVLSFHSLPVLYPLQFFPSSVLPRGVLK